MRNRKLISLTLAAVMFFSLTAFTSFEKNTLTTPKIDIQLLCHPEHQCESLSATRYGEWKLVGSMEITHSSGVRKYERTVEEYCTLCGKVLSRSTETQNRVYGFYGLIEIPY